MTQLENNPTLVRDYTLPEGCPACSADLPVRVSPVGPRAVCKVCGWFGKPLLTVTHDGLQLSYDLPKA